MSVIWRISYQARPKLTTHVFRIDCVFAPNNATSSKYLQHVFSRDLAASIGCHVGPSVGRSVGPSVGRSVGRSVDFFEKIFNSA